MPKFTNEQILEMYHKLPKALQEAIISVDTSEIIKEIGENHKLMIDKVGELADETGLVMLGLVHPKDYVPHLIERLNVDRETTRAIADEINNRIFFPVREYLKKIHGVEAEVSPLEAVKQPEVPEAPPPPQLPPIAPPPPPPKVEAAEPKPGIFEAKTKEEIFRAPIQVSEKAPEPPKTPEKPSFAEASADAKVLTDKSEGKKFDPYREPTL